MTVKTPKFIISECQRLIEALSIEHKKTAQEILEQLHQYNSLEDVWHLMDNMRKLEEKYVHPQMTPKLFKRSHISESLTKAFKQEDEMTETNTLLEMVKKMANFELSWCQEDQCYDMDRTFWVVRRQKDWNRICARAKILPSKGDIKIALEVKRPKKSKGAEIACSEISQNLYMYSSARLNYQIFFRQVEKAYYHIYLP